MAEQTKDNPPESQKTEDEPQQSDTLPKNQIDVEEVGTLKKKVTVTIPRETIDAKFDQMFGELSSTAQVPGFRIGRAPRRLIEKRFGKEISEDVRNALVGESMGDAIKKSKLRTLGEPELDLDSIELPETGDLAFSFETEVFPEFEMPELKGIKIEKPVIEITDEQLDQQLGEWAESQATFEQTDGAAQAHDMVTGGAKISVEGEGEGFDSPGLSLRVAPGQIEGIPLLELEKELTGKRTGDIAKLEVAIPEAHPNEQWRGKKAEIEISISQVQKRIVPEINDDFARGVGFDSLAEIRDAMRSRAQGQIEMQKVRNMQQQLEHYLLENTDFELPEKATQWHTERMLQRQYISLLQQGVPRERIDEQMTELQAAAGERAKQHLKLRFILGRIAEEREIAATPDEINSRVAQIASLYNRRPERLRQELAAEGTLQQLEVTLRDEKALNSLLEDAEIVEVGPDKKKPKKARKKSAGKTAKKTAKKAKKKTTGKSQDKSQSKTKKASKARSKG